VWRTEPYRSGAVNKSDQLPVNSPCGVRLPACAPVRASSSLAGFSVAQHNLHGRRDGVCGWNLGERVISSTSAVAGGILYSNPTAGISFSVRGFFRLTMKSAILASLASWSRPP